MDDDLRIRPGITALLRRYKVNVIVSRTEADVAPVVQELNPTYLNLLGRIEFGVRDGLPYTDHTMIRAGALHRANGGFLILQAYDLVSQPRAWDAVKRMIRFGVISTEGTDEGQNVPASALLRPEPIPAAIKVVLVGDFDVYAALMERDPEFQQLFKVRADFDDDMPRTSDSEGFYARFAGGAARSRGGPPLSGGAVALLIEEGSRWADDQFRLSTRMGVVRDLTSEACYWASKEGATTTSRQHMAKAIAMRERRQSLVAEKLGQQIQQGLIMIDTEGQVVGQVNGLAVLPAAEYEFGKPSRITARTAPGWTGIVNIERETEMSGPSHSRGILILSGYLTGKFGQEFPLSVAATLCFEQLYSGIDGDSASSAELYALLSSLSGAPIKQSLAVTGSVNQRGEVQAIGGANEKIEGFYRICRDRGLTGEQGVLIPRSNVRNLMLREEVVAAIRAGLFHVFAVSTIDEGIELLTGIPAGRPDPDGRYLEGTINARVSQTLRTFNERVRAYGVPATFGIHAAR
jgi:predicted ATP-dependent protease